MTDPDQTFHLAALIQSLGRRAAARAVAEAGSARAAFLRLDERRADPAALERDCRAHQIRLLAPGEAGFPELLSQIPDPPLLLYARGEPAVLNRPTVAVVGARRCTRTGTEVAAALAGGLAECGFCVVSGLARGIDAAAHRAALSAGVTAAVLGCGLARCYPAANRGLMRAIEAGGGLLLSEHPPWQSALRHHFPERNRIISGLCLAVVVVEAGEHSGSLITARLAAEQGREVGAVPGPVTNPSSRGCHRLLKQGAFLVEHVGDVLEALGMAAAPGGSRDEPPGPADPELVRVLAAVEGTLTTLDQILAATRLPAEQAAVALVELELGGFVRQVPGGYIRRPLPAVESAR